MKKATITIEDIRKANDIMQGKMARPKPVKFVPSYKLPEIVYNHESMRQAFRRAFAKIYGEHDVC